MRIAFVEACGFRGIRGQVRVSFPKGFAILTGRNGSGKSTVIDAIEFALTGTVSKYSEGSERRESVLDYLWWRGEGPAASRSVRLGIATDTGELVEITRDERGLVESPAGGIEGLLCTPRGAPANPLAELCRTSVIRDETIAALSVDLGEADRFAFVRAALGTDALESVSVQGKGVQPLVSRRVKQAESEYSRARDYLETLLSQLSQARVEADRASDVRLAQQTVRETSMGVRPASSDRSVVARSAVVESRRRIDALVHLQVEVSSLRERINAEENLLHIAGLAVLRDRVGTTSTVLGELTARLDEARRLAESDVAVAPLLGSLAQLHEHGLAVGLRDGACPLCSTKQTSAEFDRALERLQNEVAGAASDAAAHQRAFEELRLQHSAVESQLNELRSRLNAAIEQEKETRGLRTALVERAAALDVRVDDALSSEPIKAAIAATEIRLREVEVALGVLDASAAVDRIADLEARVAEARQRAAFAEENWRRAEQAEARLKRILAGIKRAVGEIVDERLASLDPLLQDLYGRLRPHVDWEQLTYRMRGDVRRLLSLRVGGDVNPRFTFSSGQRRAMGLAFLLAVHLARPWCKLRSLILDDPIQHIDDFRALHLVEVLSAIARDGQQVICAVEDEALAQLLCRRLSATDRNAGTLVEMTYTAGEGVSVLRQGDVPFPARDVLLTA